MAAKEREINLPSLHYRPDVASFISGFIKDPMNIGLQIRSLNLNNNSLGDTGLSILAHQLLPFTTTLVCLKLQYNHITSNGAIQWFECMRCNHSVNELDIGSQVGTSPSQNKIGPAGAKALAKLIST